MATAEINGKDGVAASEAMQVDGTVAAEPAQDDAKTPGKGRAKRPRVSDVAEEKEDGEDGAKPARARGKTPTAETPAKAKGARGKKEATPKPSTAKRPRLSDMPKPIKVGMNPLPVPLPIVNAMPSYSFTPTYTLPKDVDPRKPGNNPLSVFVCGTGDFGQLGLGVDNLSEVPRPRLHKWFEENSRLPQTNGQNGEAAAVSQTPVLGEYGIEDFTCGGMHSLAIDSEGKVSCVNTHPHY